MINESNSTVPVGWHIESGPVEYSAAVKAMETRAAGIYAGTTDEIIWLVEHPPLYTAGSSANEVDLIDPDRFEVHRTGRGGQYTYHGPGQRVAYVMLDVGKRYGDVRAFVRALEDWLITTLEAFNIRGERRQGRVGIWVARPEKPPAGDGIAEDKIAAIGIRLRRWISFHGVSLNVEPDLSHFSGIVPCGISDHGVTSLADLGLTATMADADIALARAFVQTFNSDLKSAPSPLLDIGEIASAK